MKVPNQQSNNQKQYTIGYISGCLFNIDFIDNYLNA